MLINQEPPEDARAISLPLKDGRLIGC